MPLDGVRVIIVEDEALVALLLEDMLTDMGCRITGTAWRLPQAEALAQSAQVDIALLDVNLAGERVYPVAEILESRAIPFVFATGYGADGVPPHLQRYRVVTKPVSRSELEQALEATLAEHR